MSGADCAAWILVAEGLKDLMIGLGVAAVVVAVCWGLGR